MFDINHGTGPQYLSELVRRCDNTRLRSNVRGNFVVSRTRLHVSLTDKAFSLAGPRAWNARPSDLIPYQLLPQEARDTFSVSSIV